MTGAAKGQGHASWVITTCGFPPCGESEALVLRTLHMIVGTSYRISFLRDASGVGAFIPWLMVGWWGSFLRLYFLFFRGKLYIPRICRLLVLLGIRSLTSRLSATRKA